jgi:hypothetical protein
MLLTLAETDCVAGVRGLELGNVGFLKSRLSSSFDSLGVPTSGEAAAQERKSVMGVPAAKEDACHIDPCQSRSTNEEQAL